MLTFFRKKTGAEQMAAEALYSALLIQSRQPYFYTDLQVPDTVDGRFDMVLLHSFVVLRRLSHLGKTDKTARRLSQAVYDVMFVDMDRAVREMGIGDLSVKKHIRRMMKAFNGRVAAYEAGLANDAVQHDALRRNLYGTVKTEIPPAVLDVMTDYLKSSVRNVDLMDMDGLVKGSVPWGALPNDEMRKRA